MAQNKNENVCRKLHEELGYSIGEMAKALGLKKATYQCYENGTRPVPESIIEEMKDLLTKDRNFFKRYVPGGELDRELDRLYPNGIVCDLNDLL